MSARGVEHEEHLTPAERVEQKIHRLETWIAQHPGASPADYRYDMNLLNRQLERAHAQEIPVLARPGLVVWEPDEGRRLARYRGLTLVAGHEQIEASIKVRNAQVYQAAMADPSGVAPREIWHWSDLYADVLTRWVELVERQQAPLRAEVSACWCSRGLRLYPADYSAFIIERFRGDGVSFNEDLRDDVCGACRWRRREAWRAERELSCSRCGHVFSRVWCDALPVMGQMTCPHCKWPVQVPPVQDEVARPDRSEWPDDYDEWAGMDIELSDIGIPDFD